MKKLLLIILTTTCLSVHAQEKQFNFSIGAGALVSPEAEFLIALEPKVRVSEATRIGLSSRIGFGSFRSFVFDVNFKPNKDGVFYLGAGVGTASFDFDVTNPITGGALGGKSSSTVFAPRIGFQSSFDFDVTMYISGNDALISLAISKVIGYKKNNDEG